MPSTRKTRLRLYASTCHRRLMPAPLNANSAQISIADLSRLKSEGFRSIICNRPDGEGPGQTKFADIAMAAKELGLQAWHQPIEPGKVTAADAQVFERKTGELPQPIFAYCRAGMRCTNLWKLSHPGQSTLEP